MNNLNLNICLLPHAIGKPHYASENAAGIDLSAGTPKNIAIKSNEYQIIPTGIQIEIPQGFEGQIRPRSGLALKHGLSVLNTPGTIDSDYRGEIRVLLINLGKDDFLITPGMRIAQLIIAPVLKASIKFVDMLETKSERGEKGFGSTGTKSN